MEIAEAQERLEKEKTSKLEEAGSDESESAEASDSNWLNKKNKH